MNAPSNTRNSPIKPVVPGKPNAPSTNITNINEKLIIDEKLNGGGLHEIKKGGLLKIHSDFNRHPILNLDRRLNVLVYLNKDWKEDYGGHLQLWDKEMQKCEKKIFRKMKLEFWFPKIQNFRKMDSKNLVQDD